MLAMSVVSQLPTLLHYYTEECNDDGVSAEDKQVSPCFNRFVTIPVIVINLLFCTHPP